MKDAKYMGNYQVWLRFSDGLSGTVDLADQLWGPMFEPLRNTGELGKVSVHPELQTLVWPNGADLAPEFLYQQLRHSQHATV